MLLPIPATVSSSVGDNSFHLPADVRVVAIKEAASPHFRIISELS
jgi:hypothetical protein